IKELFALYDTDQSDTQLIKMLHIIDEKEAMLKRQLEDIGIVLEELNLARLRCEDALKNTKS
ncbi:MerR family transcriptional regulator, partial [Vibrio xuii]